MIGVVIGYTSLTVMGCEVTLAKDKYVPRQECGKQTTVDRPDTGTQDKEGESNDFFFHAFLRICRLFISFPLLRRRQFGSSATFWYVKMVIFIYFSSECQRTKGTTRARDSGEIKEKE